MKKNRLYFLGAMMLIGAANVLANPIDLTKARQIAAQFCKDAVAKKQMRMAPSGAKLTLAYKAHGRKRGTHLLYVFDRGAANGFVVVSGDDHAPQVLGYADSGSFDLQRMPENMRWWVDQYAQQVQYLMDNPQMRLTPARKTSQVVAPLLGDITWNQESPYNGNCPYMSYYDEYEEETISGTAPTGCVATALAQIMRYHQWPLENHGNVSYTTVSLEQEITADLNATYNWSLMLPTYGGVEATAEQKAEVAKLMFNIGAALESDYTPSGTGAYDISVVPALVKYFGYDAGARYVPRDYTPVADYEQGLINEIESGRPVAYGGVTKKNSGHFFVLDGINEDGYYHVNWGWGGLSDGYFLISSLEPDEQGVGGSTSTYTSYKYHQVYISGIQKPQEQSRKGWGFLVDNLSEIDDSYAKGEEIRATIYDGYNTSSTDDTLKCKLYWDLYKADGTLVYQHFVKNDTLALNYGFEKENTSFVIPQEIADGDYTMRLEFTQSEDDYTTIYRAKVKANSNQYYKVHVEGDDVSVSTASGVRLSIESVTPDTLKAGQACDIDVTFRNTGEDFVGDFNFFLYVDGKKNIYPSFNSPQRIVSIPADSTVTLRFNENIPEEMVTDSNYVLQFYYYTLDEDGYTDKNKAANVKVAVDGADKPASLYILDDVDVLSEVDGQVPMNDIRLGVNFENEGAEYNAPIMVEATTWDDWDFKDSFMSDTINVPGDCEGKYVVLQGELTKVEEGQTYELCLYTDDGEYISPSDKNSFEITMAGPVSSVSMTMLGKGILWSNNAITASGATEIRLYALDGSLVAKVAGNRLSTQSLQKGCYIVRVNTANGTELKKIVVK